MNASSVQSGTSRPPRENSASAASPLTTCSDPRLRGVASVRIRVPVGCTNELDDDPFAEAAQACDFDIDEISQSW